MQIYFADALKQAQEIYDKLASNCERMVTECKDKGYFVRDGYLWRKRDGEKIPVSQEKDFFSITGLQYIEPSLRIY